MLTTEVRIEPQVAVIAYTSYEDKTFNNSGIFAAAATWLVQRQEVARVS